MNASDFIAILVGCVLLGIAVPWLGMRMLVPSLVESSAAMTHNYAGRPVFYGLGIAWLIWAGCAIIGGVAAQSTSVAPTLGVLALAGPLALVAFALGAVDDAYGTGAARGFKGHLKAMLGGRLTTGGLKLVGIGTASLVVAFIIGEVAPWGRSGGASVDHALRVLAAGAAIALTSNAVNLMDLRPGRALKVYSVLAVLGALVCTLGLRGAVGAPGSPALIALETLALGLFVTGPVFAVWRYDLREIGMLGDAGANPMGAVAGLLIVSGLPLWALLAYLGLMLVLNLASERVSYSRVIDSSSVLSWLDGLGRVPAAGPQRHDG